MIGTQLWTTAGDNVGIDQKGPRGRGRYRVLLTKKSLLPALLVAAAPLMALDPHTKITDFVHTAWGGGELTFEGVHNLIQTKDGILWLSGSGGLFRFDGIRFTRFEPFSRTNIRNMLATRDGSLWVVFDTGLVSRLSGGQVTTFSLQELPRTNALAEDRDGSIVAATANGGLARFRDGRWQEAARALHLSTKRSYFVWFDREGVLWLVTEDRLLKLLPGEDHFTDIGIPTRLSFLRDLLAQSPDGAVWFANWRSALSVKPGERKTEVKVGANAVMFDRQGSLWLGGNDDSGLWRVPIPAAIAGRNIAPPAQELEQFTKKDGLSGSVVYCVLEDREGNVWVGTDHGLDRFRPGAFHKVAIPDADRINRLQELKDGGLLTTIRGRPYLQRIGPDGKATMLHLPLPAISTCEATDGTIWVSTSSGFGRVTPQGISYPPQPSLTAIRNLGCGHGDLWISDDTLGVFRFSAGKAIRLPGLWAQVNQFLPVGPGQVWVAYPDSRISFFDNGAIRDYGSADGVPEGAVWDILRVGGDIWLAAEGGVARFRNGRFQHVDMAIRRRTDAILSGDGTFLWFRAGSSLNRFDTREFDQALANPGFPVHVEGYGALDGIPGAINLAAGSGQHIWLATTERLGYLNIKPYPSSNPWPPPVRIEAITADGKAKAAAEGLVLPKLTHDLQIDYTAFSLTIPEKVRFRYKLEGRDEDWREAGTKRQAYYTDLAPKKYRFLVKAANNDGVWNEEGASLGFSIDPAYYQSIWFQALCACAFLSLLSALYRWRVSEISAQMHGRLEARVAERTRIARDLHDTLLQSFQGLMLRLQVVDELLPEGKAKEQLEQSLQRADQAIAEGRIAVYDLRSSATNANDLASAVKMLGDEMATPDAATFRLVVEGTARDLHPIIRDELYRISREALRNAFNHSHAGHIETEITYGERALRLHIRDNGEGIPPEVLENGRPGHYGLPGIRERASQMGGKLDIRSAAGAGTEIQVSVAASIAYRGSKDRSLFGRFRNKGGEL